MDFRTGSRIGPRRKRWGILGFFSVAAFCGSLFAAASAGEPPDYSAARKLFEVRAYAKARTEFVALAQTRPDDVALSYYSGRLAWWFDDAEGAVAALERAARSDPKDARIYNALGDAYGLMALNVNLFAKFGWAKKCLAAHERAVVLDPADIEARWGLFGYYCLAPDLAGGGYEKAAAQAKIISQLNIAEGRIASCTLALAQREYTAGFMLFEPVLQSNPDDYSALYQIGRCAAESGQQLGRGEASLRRCLKLPPPLGERMPTAAEVHYRLSMILEKKGDHPGAQRESAIARRIFPDLNPDKTALYL